MATIQQMLKEIHSKGFTQEKIGQWVGLSQGAVSRLMNGMTQCTYKQGLKIKEMHDSQVFQGRDTADQIEIKKWKERLLAEQASKQRFQMEAMALQQRLNERSSCFCCRFKAFFKGE